MMTVLPIRLGKGKRSLRIFQDTIKQREYDCVSITMTHRSSNEVGIARVVNPLSKDEESRRIGLLQEYMLNKAHEVIYEPY